MAVHRLNEDELDSLHGIHMTEEAFEQMTNYEADQTIKLDQLDLELPLASIYAGVF